MVIINTLGKRQEELWHGRLIFELFRVTKNIPSSAEIKKITRFDGYRITSMFPIFRNELLIFQSKINSDDNILFW